MHRPQRPLLQRTATGGRTTTAASIGYCSGLPGERCSCLEEPEQPSELGQLQTGVTTQHPEARERKGEGQGSLGRRLAPAQRSIAQQPSWAQVAACLLKRTPISNISRAERGLQARAVKPR